MIVRARACCWVSFFLFFFFFFFSSSFASLHSHAYRERLQFWDAVKRDPSAVWICKPTGMNQGKVRQVLVEYYHVASVAASCSDACLATPLKLTSSMHFQGIFIIKDLSEFRQQLEDEDKAARAGRQKHVHIAQAIEAHTHTHTYTYTHAHIHIHTRTHTHSHTHTYTHTHVCIQSCHDWLVFSHAAASPSLLLLL